MLAIGDVAAHQNILLSSMPCETNQVKIRNLEKKHMIWVALTPLTCCHFGKSGKKLNMGICQWGTATGKGQYADPTVSRGRPQSALADATAQSRQNERPKWGVEGVTVIGFFQHY